MKQTFLKLDWDSDFFHFNVCNLNSLISNYEDLKAVDTIMDNGKFKLAYYSSVEALNLYSIESLEIKLVDKKTTYVKKISCSLIAHPLIFSYESIFPSSKLIDLAIQCGIYSRFNVDKNIGKEKFEELYTLWIIKSVKKEIAKEVIVYMHDSDIAGYLTIGEKNNRANVGMVALDSNYRGKGVGRMLFEYAEKWSFDNGYKDIEIVTQGDNIPACKLYESLGYTVERMEYFYHIWKE
jgi:dTDP-4-amino-4,6-dideoxy-D-galactose acyltransferase